MGREIKITFTGDILCQLDQQRAVCRAHCDWDVVFADVKRLWQDSDYVVGNLETPVAGKKYGLCKELMRFNAPVEFLEALKRAGFGFLGYANNHSLDRELPGLDETLRNLRKSGIDTTGAYATREDSEQILIKEIAGVKFAFIACTYGTNQGRRRALLKPDEYWRLDLLKHPEPYEYTRLFEVVRFLKSFIPIGLKRRIRRALKKSSPTGRLYCRDCAKVQDVGNAENLPFENRIREKIRRAKKLADIVVVLPHVGGQLCPEPGEWQVATMNWLSEAGADLIVGNHAHIIQKVEHDARGVLCAYALGDFCSIPWSEDGYSSAADCSLLLNVYYDSETRRLVRYETVKLRNVRNVQGVCIVQVEKCP